MRIYSIAVLVNERHDKYNKQHWGYTTIPSTETIYNKYYGSAPNPSGRFGIDKRVGDKAILLRCNGEMTISTINVKTIR